MLKNTYKLSLLLALLVFVSCEQPHVTTLGTAITAGDIKFSLDPYEVRLLELHEGGKSYAYARPVIAIPLTMTNAGQDAFSYSPTHSTQQMSESSTPLLYKDPGPDESLPPESKTPINGVFLEKGQIDGQKFESTQIGAGESLTVIFLFEVPDDAVDGLVFSVPPSMHRGKTPVLFRFTYTPQEPKGPKIHNMSSPIAFGDVTFTIDSAAYEFVSVTDVSAGKGFSDTPLLKVTYTINNNGKEEVSFDPAHRDVSGRGAALFGKSTTFKRVKFPGSVTVLDQLKTVTTIAPGSSVKDFVLFDVPSQDETGATLEFPATLFGANGIARVNLTMAAGPPPVPKELKKKAPKPSDG